MTNQIRTIKPYKENGTWMFDDHSVKLEREPFVAGIPEIIEEIAERQGFTNAEMGFNLLFSDQPFHSNEPIWTLIRFKEESDGAWYRLQISAGYKMEGWLCPALMKYFESPPDRIYISATEIAHGGKLRVWAIRNPPAKPEFWDVPNLDAAKYFILGMIQSDLGSPWVKANVFGLEVFENGEWAEWEDQNGEDIMFYLGEKAV